MIVVLDNVHWILLLPNNIGMFLMLYYGYCILFSVKMCDNNKEAIIIILFFNKQ